jgi:integrating conjugative element protein (TIGR03757 family)
MRNIGYAKHLLQQVNATLEIYNLDEVHSFEDLFSKGLPANEEEARKVFEQRMNAYGAKKFEQEIVQAYQGLFNALVYEVDRYPVIIFNKTDAIYGMTDLKAALFKYQQWRLENDQ